jgi:hypothetical protein
MLKFVLEMGTRSFEALDPLSCHDPSMLNFVLEMGTRAFEALSLSLSLSMQICSQVFRVLECGCLF